MRIRWMSATLVAALAIGACGKDKVTVVQQDTGPVPPEWVHVALTSASAITVRWADVATDEVGYVVERSISSTSGFSALIETVANAEEYVDATVAAGTTYYYRARTKDAVGRLSEAPHSGVLGRAVDNAAPVTPATPDPADNSSNLDLTGPPTLTWQTSDPDGPLPACDFYFGESRSSLALEASGLTTYSHVLPDTLAHTRWFYWRVVATDEYGATALSPIWSFGTKVERISVPAGYFVMGDCGTLYPLDPFTFCSPTNPVMTGGFSIDKLEVSNQFYAQFLNELLTTRYITVDHGLVTEKLGGAFYAAVYPDGDQDSGIEFVDNTSGGIFLPRAGRENHPVMEVTWYGARRFAEHYGRRLPTEAEWEKAARGTSTELGIYRFTVGDVADSVGIGFPFPWGTQVSGAYFNYSGSGDPYDTNVGIQTTPIGFFDGTQKSGFATRSNASPYGVYDMAGNVSEWCEDAFQPYHGGANLDLKVVKGGGWRSLPEWCSTFWRAGEDPDTTDNLIGFRTAASE
jgi:formylglycine-generating enzyme required for sulfatase activity